MRDFIVYERRPCRLTHFHKQDKDASSCLECDGNGVTIIEADIREAIIESIKEDISFKAILNYVLQ